MNTHNKMILLVIIFMMSISYLTNGATKIFDSIELIILKCDILLIGNIKEITPSSNENASSEIIKVDVEKCVYNITNKTVPSKITVFNNKDEAGVKYENGVRAIFFLKADKNNQLNYINVNYRMSDKGIFTQYGRLLSTEDDISTYLNVNNRMISGDKSMTQIPIVQFRLPAEYDSYKQLSDSLGWDTILINVPYSKSFEEYIDKLILSDNYDTSRRAKLTKGEILEILNEKNVQQKK